MTLLSELSHTKTPATSRQLLHSGTPEHFINALCSEALEHPAVNHDYLQMISNGDFPNMKAVLRDYAHQYSFYSKDFPSYVEGIINGLSNQKHKDVILENLEEEEGLPGSTDLKTMPHVQLFEFFKSSLGCDQDYIAKTKPCTTSLVWRDLFLQKCNSKQEGLGIGALGIATEFIVPTIYRYLLKGIKNHTDLNENDYFFFTLHADCDTHHADDINNILTELAEDADCREAIRFGVHSALNLRKAFWDVMLSRALSYKEIG